LPCIVFLEITLSAIGQGPGSLSETLHTVKRLLLNTSSESALRFQRTRLLRVFNSEAMLSLFLRNLETVGLVAIAIFKSGCSCVWALELARFDRGLALSRLRRRCR